jgi:hypothetical protein
MLERERIVIGRVIWPGVFFRLGLGRLGTCRSGIYKIVLQEILQSIPRVLRGNSIVQGAA